jgi:hypothetical protein
MLRVACAVALAWVFARAVNASGDHPVAPQDQSPNTALNQAPDSLVMQITRLLRARMDPALIAGFVRQWPTPYLTSIDDLARLRQAGADSNVLSVFARRGAELRLKTVGEVQQSSTAPRPTNAPVVIFYPVPVYQRSLDLGPPQRWSGPPYIFSEALWWWANFYPLPYDSLGWGWALPRHPFRRP